MTARRSCVASLSLLGLACSWLAVAPPTLEAQRNPRRPAIKRPAQGRNSGQRILPQRRSKNASARKNSRTGDANGQLLRLMQMSPDARKNFFETNQRFLRLPESRRKAIQHRLDELDQLPAEEKEILVARYQLFNQLPRERQAAAREIYEEWRKMERERRNQVVAAVRRLRSARQERRALMLESERFQSTYDDDERAMIEQLLELTPKRAESVRD